ncbi:MAG: hypothetical protein AVDCRST_MAG91-3397 [uncultured Sphingomonadaceae bacterium]|uniref:Uncharacterized protein n=1 Tax=uncultured Sphingomonadaceae bacterium TaxID=169976 RepID=A0A6J4U1B1_9SPHN|nr:MAG: hypothetical protein AVDCRST_MAG91-3397 [uncultured Sphingomonadaceae bacterium]
MIGHARDLASPGRDASTGPDTPARRTARRERARRNAGRAFGPGDRSPLPWC